jgi:hypothetical protein
MRLLHVMMNLGRDSEIGTHRDSFCAAIRGASTSSTLVEDDGLDQQLNNLKAALRQ